MLDQIRRDIQSRLDELLGEVDKLRRALAALTSRDGGESAGDRAKASTAAASTVPAADATPAGTRSRRTGAGARSTATATRKNSTSPPATRTAPGATKAAVLAALADGKAMTAGEIATATGLGRATISTTLSKLARNGEVQKADRGYFIEHSASDGEGAQETAAE